jgi:uncharacterized protein (DUF433 family)
MERCSERERAVTLPDFLAIDEHDEWTIRGTRVGLFHFLHDYDQGESAESLAVQFPQIGLATVHKVIAFYLENREEVDRYWERYARDLDAIRSQGPRLPLAELRERLGGKKASSVPVAMSSLNHVDVPAR